MDLRPIKENLTWPMKAAQYRLGVEGFMSYAIKTLTCDGKLRCPCMKCVNHKLLSPDDVNLHLLHFGMMHNYTIWIFHGEKVDPVLISSPSEPMVEDEILPYTDMRQLVHDAYGHRGDDPNISENGDQSTHGQNKEAQDFYTLLNDADTELWPGCELTKLSFLVLLFHIKSTNKWTNKSFNDLLGFCQLAIPNSANLPKSFAEAKKNQIKNIVAEQGDQSVNLDNDPVSKVLGKDKYGRVRGLGLLGVKPSNFVEPSVPSYCKCLKMSSKDEGAILYYLREQRRCVKNQGATILKLRRKLQEHLGSDFDDSEFDDLSDDLTESGSD
ncbi:hypothetical protein BVRB_015430, partial [Beta vulgaris subsp. vulgaris]